MEELSIWVDEDDPYDEKTKKKVFTLQKEVDPLGIRQTFPRLVEHWPLLAFPNPSSSVSP